MSTGLIYILYLLFAAAGVGVYLALPRAGGGYVRSGFVVGVGALAGLLALCAHSFMAPHGSNIFFYFFGAVALLAAGRVVTHTNATYSAVYFGLVVLAVAVLLVMQRAEFLAVALVIIYAGAILVTYAFVIMLAQQSGASAPDVRSREPLMAVLASFVVMGAIAGQVGEISRLPTEPPGIEQKATVAAAVPLAAVERREVGNTLAVGRSMFGQYVVVVQLAGLLLLVAMVGAIAVSRKQVPVEDVGPPPPPPGTIGRQVPPF